jgi:hypothetical protein
MNEIETIKLKYLIGCLGIRTLFAIIAKYINKKYLPFMGIFAIIISMSFIYQFITKERTHGAFNNKIWWDNIRPIHAFNYGLFGFLAINKSSYAWIFLLFDVFIGLGGHLYHYYL